MAAAAAQKFLPTLSSSVASNQVYADSLFTNLQSKLSEWENDYYVAMSTCNRDCARLFPKFSLLTKIVENRDRSQDKLNS